MMFCSECNYGNWSSCSAYSIDHYEWPHWRDIQELFVLDEVSLDLIPALYGCQPPNLGLASHLLHINWYLSTLIIHFLLFQQTSIFIHIFLESATLIRNENGRDKHLLTNSASKSSSQRARLECYGDRRSFEHPVGFPFFQLFMLIATSQTSFIARIA